MFISDPNPTKSFGSATLENDVDGHGYLEQYGSGSQPTYQSFSKTKYKNSPIGSLHGLANLIIATVQVILACGGLAARL